MQRYAVTVILMRLLREVAAQTHKIAPHADDSTAEDFNSNRKRDPDSSRVLGRESKHRQVAALSFSSVNTETLTGQKFPAARRHFDSEQLSTWEAEGKPGFRVVFFAQDSSKHSSVATCVCWPMRFLLCCAVHRRSGSSAHPGGQRLPCTGIPSTSQSRR